MKRLLYFSIVLVLAVSTSNPAILFGQDQQNLSEKKSESGSNTITLGQTQSRTYQFKEAGKEMEYSLYVPKGYDKTKKWPLVVALHGLFSSPRQIMRYPGMTRSAEKHGYIVVAPMGYNSRGWYGSRGQSSRRSKPENLGELSEKDVMNVLNITRKEFNVDENRIYLMGHSMGGGGTWHLGIKYPGIWAALAPIAPAARRSTDGLEKIKHIPVIVVQGDNDPLVPVARTRLWVEKMKQLKMDYNYIEVPDGDHVRVAFDNLPKIFEFFNKHQKKTKQPNKTSSQKNEGQKNRENKSPEESKTKAPEKVAN